MGARRPLVRVNGRIAALPAGDTLDKASVGLGSVDNTADANKPVSTAQQDALNLKIATSQRGVANGVATLDASGLVPAAQLPSYVDDVIEVASQASLPTTGEPGKIYITDDTNQQYRWSGSQYVPLVASPGTTDAVPEGTTNKYFTAARVLATALAGIGFSDSSAVVAADTVLSGLGKLQAQITAAASVLAANVRGTVLTGLVTTSSAAVAATDSVLVAFGKLQARLNALGTAANANLTTSTTDTTIGSVMKVGDFGLGSDVILLASGVNWDTVTTPGLYFIPSATGTNAPLSGGNFFLQVVKSGTSIKQIATLFGSATAFERPQSSGTWLAWDKRVTLSTVIGTVSQIGGVPTGTIFETNTNANGTYTKYADGTMICFYTQTAAVTTSAGGSAPFSGLSGGMTFPATFISVPKVLPLAHASTNAPCWATTQYAGTSTTAIYLFSNSTSGAAQPGYVAVGRWF